MLLMMFLNLKEKNLLPTGLCGGVFLIFYHTVAPTELN
jgi:hypothetical protein